MIFVRTSQFLLIGALIRGELTLAKHLILCLEVNDLAYLCHLGKLVN